MNEKSHKKTELAGFVAPAHASKEEAFAKGPGCRRFTQLRIAFWIVAGITGFMQIWFKDYIVWGDTLSYLDSGDMLWRGDFAHAITPIWGPGLPFLLGLALKLLHPVGLWELAVVKLVDLTIFLFTMGSFSFLVDQFCRYHETKAASEYPGAKLAVPKLALATVSYLLFIWTVTDVIPAWVTTPDMLVMGIVFVIFGLLLRMEMGAKGLMSFTILGVALGFGYLVKAPMFLFAFMFLGIAFLLVGDFKKAIPRVALAFVLFALIAAPLVWELSKLTGGLTFGKSGAWNYARGVDGIGVPYHWRGLPAGSGIPLHPTRVIFQNPTVYEFGSPVGGTFPPWTDPYYWFAGITPHFDLTGQWRVIKANAKILKGLAAGLNRSFVYGFLILLCMSSDRRLVGKLVARQWFLLVPSIAAVAMFSVVHVEGRYIAPFLLVIGLVLFSCVAVVRANVSLRLVSTVAALAVVLLAASSLKPAIAETLSFARSLHKNEILGRGEPWQATSATVGDALTQSGLRKGDRIAYIGKSGEFYWARLAGLQVNAEIFQFDPNDFLDFPARTSVLADLQNNVDIYWAAPPERKVAIDDIFRGLGSRAVVTDAIPSAYVTGDWRQVPGTAYYIHLLSEHTYSDNKVHDSTISPIGQ